MRFVVYVGFQGGSACGIHKNISRGIASKEIDGIPCVRIVRRKLACSQCWEDIDISPQPLRHGRTKSHSLGPAEKPSTSIRESNEVSEKDIFIVCSSWMRILCGDHQTYGHMVDIVIRFYDFPKPEPEAFDFKSMGNSLYEGLSRFLKTLPPLSKRHIWEHAVRIRTPDGKRVCDSTQSRRHINKLISDCVIVYIKYLDRDRKPLPSVTVRPHVEPVAQFIHLNYHSIQQGRFENERAYFPQMLMEYVQSQSSQD